MAKLNTKRVVTVKNELYLSEDDILAIIRENLSVKLGAESKNIKIELDISSLGNLNGAVVTSEKTSVEELYAGDFS